jgi:predicted RNA binding protein YcfA (HicA-like mRNA interferase family)
MLPMKVRDLVKLVEADGWRLVRTKGSHRQFHHPSKRGTVTISGNAGIDVPIGTMNTVLKQAGLKE